MIKQLENEANQMILVAEKFIIEKRIGKGSFCEVYQGYDKHSKAPVAIKLVSYTLLPPYILNSPKSFFQCNLIY